MLSNSLRILFLIPLFFSLVPHVVSASNSATNSTKIAVLIDTKYDMEDQPYPYNLYYQQKEGVINALQYNGISYNVVHETIDIDSLKTYGGLITVLGDSRQVDALTTSWTQKRNKTSLILYIHGGGENYFKNEVGIIENSNIGHGHSNPIVNYTDSFTKRINDSYGSLIGWDVHSLLIDTSKSSVIYYLNQSDNQNMPILFRLNHDNGNYIIYNTELAAINGHNAIYFYNLVLDYADNMLGSYNRLYPYPFGVRAPVIIRLDDFNSTNPVNKSKQWMNFWNESKQMTTAAIPRDIPDERLQELPEYSNDIEPHGWKHEDWTTLNLAQQETLLGYIQSKWLRAYKKYPSGMVLPYNRANGNTSKAANLINGFKWYTATVGESPIIQRQNAFFDNNHIYEFSGEYDPEAYNSEGAIAFMLRVLTQNRSGMFVYHPYQVNSTDYPEKISEVHSIIDHINNQNGYRLTTLSELMEYFYDTRQNVTLTDNYLNLTSDIRGIAIVSNSIKSNQAIKIDSDKVSIRKYGNIIQLPTIETGNHTYSIVDNLNYPEISYADAGLTIKDGYFDISKNELTDLVIDAYTYPTTGTIIKNFRISRSNAIFDNSTISLYNGGEDISIRLNGEKTLRKLDMSVKGNATLKIELYNKAKNITRVIISIKDGIIDQINLNETISGYIYTLKYANGTSIEKSYPIQSQITFNKELEKGDYIITEGTEEAPINQPTIQSAPISSGTQTEINARKIEGYNSTSTSESLPISTTGLLVVTAVTLTGIILWAIRRRNKQG